MIDIQGCQFSSDQSSLAILGRTIKYPVVIELETRDGTITNFIQMISENDNIAETYDSFASQAVFIDKRDVIDRKQYIYAAYQQDGATSILRILNED